jgi:hypothetical protein
MPPFSMVPGAIWCRGSFPSLCHAACTTSLGRGQPACAGTTNRILYTRLRCGHHWQRRREVWQWNPGTEAFRAATMSIVRWRLAVCVSSWNMYVVQGYNPQFYVYRGALRPTDALRLGSMKSTGSPVPCCHSQEPVDRAPT